MITTNMSFAEQHSEQLMAVPDYIDAACDSVPHSTYAIVPRSPSSVSEGWDHVTFEDVARAVDKMAHWIEKTCGIAEQVGQTIGYMGYVTCLSVLPTQLTARDTDHALTQCERLAILCSIRCQYEDRIHTIVYITKKLA